MASPALHGKTINALGLMSGTSMDGLDIAQVSVDFATAKPRFDLIAFESTEYPGRIRDAIAAAVADPDFAIRDLSRLDFDLAHYFSASVLAFLDKRGMMPDEIDLIGSHGQTICHLPAAGADGVWGPATLQIGDPGVLAARTGILTVGDFRPADMALGGQGAPLAPFMDYHFLHETNKNQLFVNIGGLANLCALRAGCGADEVVAFDTGPGNVILDHLARSHFAERYDDGGRRAGQGRCHPGLLQACLENAFYLQQPPKSADRQEMLNQFLAAAQHHPGARLSGEDLLATAAELTIVSIHQACENFLDKTSKWDEMIISGGGAKNHYLMDGLRRLFHGTAIMTSSEIGVPVEAKEAICFALLGCFTLMGRPGNLPAATGAGRAAVLGKICPGYPRNHGDRIEA